MMAIRKCVYVWLGLLLVACAKNDPTPDEVDDALPFSEGTIEMGMYGRGVDLGYFIDRIDFSRDDVREQFEELSGNTEEGQQLAAILQEYSRTNPFAALGLIINASSCTYYIKGDVVLGKAKGFGYTFDNYHDAKNDQGKVFVRTEVQTTEIPEEDRALSVTYIPSVDLGMGSGGAIETSWYDRQVAAQTEVVAGYPCTVSTYTIKTQYIPEPDPENPLPQSPVCYKLVVYTSSAFNKTINFTHPFYLPEDSGILKLEIYYDDGEEPTLVMQPKEISPRAIGDAEMQIEERQPVYDINDPSLAWKILAIFFSGWGALDMDGD